MKYYNEIEQGTNEWFEIRRGKMTASHAQAIGSCGKGLDSYILEMMADFFSSGERDTYTNKDMERGNELEGQARSMYELETGNTVVEVGFCEYSECVGCSPDGLIENDGLIEIKCKNDKNYLKHLLDGKLESKYVWQVQAQLLITGRSWCDVVIYNPNFTTPFIIERIYADEAKFEKLLEGFEKGEEMIAEIKVKIANGKPVSAKKVQKIFATNTNDSSGALVTIKEECDSEIKKLTSEMVKAENEIKAKLGEEKGSEVIKEIKASL